MQLATPDFSHLTSTDFEHVYEPAEDTFIFLDALQQDYAQLKSVRPTVCLEIGCGSGVVSAFLAKLLGCAVCSVCTDVNVHAANAAHATAQQNDVVLQPVIMDLASCFLPRLASSVDVLLFNPPYVVTPPEEVGGNGLSASWAGGDRGRQVLDRFLPDVTNLLSDRGLFYLVAIRENDINDIQNTLAFDGLHMSVVLTRRSGPETLFVLRFSRQQNDAVR